MNCLVRIATAISLLAFPTASLGITINETIARLWLPGSGYEHDLGRSRAGLLLSVSTTDGWRTADFSVVIRGHQRIGMSLVYFTIPTTSGQNNYSIIDVKGSAFFDLSDFARYGNLLIQGYNNDRLRFTLSSTDSNFNAWSAVGSGGFKLEHYFFGGEYLNSARLILDDPGVGRYKILLGEAAAVPIPPTLALAMGGILPLVFLRAKSRRKVFRGRYLRRARA